MIEDLKLFFIQLHNNTGVPDFVQKIREREWSGNALLFNRFYVFISCIGLPFESWGHQQLVYCGYQ